MIKRTKFFLIGSLVALFVLGAYSAYRYYIINQPNLVPASIECSGRSGFLFVTAHIKNTGHASAPPFDTSVTVNGMTVTTSDPNALAAQMGDPNVPEAQIGFFFDSIAIPGSFSSISVTADPGSAVSEENENDNTLSGQSCTA
jgi:hypothetical protein